MKSNNSNTESATALEWWNGLGLVAIMQIEDKYSVGRNDVSRTEITNIYKAEHPQPLKEVVNDDSMEGFIGYALNLPDNLKEKGIMEFVQPIFEENTQLKEQLSGVLKEIESIKRNNDKINQHTWATYKEQVSLHIMEIQSITTKK